MKTITVTDNIQCEGEWWYKSSSVILVNNLDDRVKLFNMLLDFGRDWEGNIHLIQVLPENPSIQKLNDLCSSTEYTEIDSHIIEIIKTEVDLFIYHEK